MKNFIVFAVLVCISLVASGSKIRNTAVLDQNIRERAPVRIPTQVQQKMQNSLLMQRLATGKLNLKAGNKSGGSSIQPITGQPNQHHQNQNQYYYDCRHCNRSYAHGGHNCC